MPTALAAANFCAQHLLAQECVDLARMGTEASVWGTRLLCVLVGFYIGAILKLVLPKLKRNGKK